MLKTPCSQCRGIGLIPSWRSKVLLASQQSPQNRKLHTHTHTPLHNNPGAEKDWDSTRENCWTPRKGWQWLLQEASFTTSHLVSSPQFLADRNIPLLMNVKLTFSGLRLSLKPQPPVRPGASQTWTPPSTPTNVTSVLLPLCKSAWKRWVSTFTWPCFPQPGLMAFSFLLCLRGPVVPLAPTGLTKRPLSNDGLSD